LIALLGVLPPGGHDPFDELEVRFNENFVSHGSYLL
jgi:hypothetical protein